MSTNQQQKLARVLYRSFLRVSKNGRHPEVFGQYGKQAKNSQLPCNANEVRTILRDVFRGGNKSVLSDKLNDAQNEKNEQQSQKYGPTEAFAALRHSNEMASILIPRKDELPPALPIFDYTDAGVLMGEEIQFNFFEPRYLKLAKEAISRDGTFILGQRKSSSLLKIVEHINVPSGSIVVRCISGPRIKILRREEVKVKGGSPLSQATGFDFQFDEAVDKHDEKLHQQDLFAMRARCLDLLQVVDSRTNITSSGLPPIDPERFSFWVLRFILSQNDNSSRQKWLACLSTSMRLQYVIEFFESFQNVMKSSEDKTSN